MGGQLRIRCSRLLTRRLGECMFWEDEVSRQLCGRTSDPPSEKYRCSTVGLGTARLQPYSIAFARHIP